MGTLNGNIIEVVDIRLNTGAESKLKAFADLRICEGVILKGFSVIKSPSGLAVLLPRKVAKDGRFYEMVLLSEKMTDEIEAVILEAYDKETTTA